MTAARYQDPVWLSPRSGRLRTQRNRQNPRLQRRQFQIATAQSPLAAAQTSRQRAVAMAMIRGIVKSTPARNSPSLAAILILHARIAPCVPETSCCVLKLSCDRFLKRTLAAELTDVNRNCCSFPSLGDPDCCWTSPFPLAVNLEKKSPGTLSVETVFRRP